MQGAFADTVDFHASYTNPLPDDASGSIRTLVYVRANNLSLGTPSANIDASSHPDFATPATAVYPAQKQDGYTSPVALNIAWDPGVIYDIDIKTFLPGQDGWDGTPCHHFEQKGFRVPRG